MLAVSFSIFLVGKTNNTSAQNVIIPDTAFLVSLLNDPFHQH